MSEYTTLHFTKLADQNQKTIHEITNTIIYFENTKTFEFFDGSQWQNNVCNQFELLPNDNIIRVTMSYKSQYMTNISYKYPIIKVHTILDHLDRSLKNIFSIKNTLVYFLDTKTFEFFDGTQWTHYGANGTIDFKSNAKIKIEKIENMSEMQFIQINHNEKHLYEFSEYKNAFFYIHDTKTFEFFDGSQWQLCNLNNLKNTDKNVIHAETDKNVIHAEVVDTLELKAVFANVSTVATKTLDTDVLITNNLDCRNLHNLSAKTINLKHMSLAERNDLVCSSGTLALVKDENKEYLSVHLHGKWYTISII